MINRLVSVSLVILLAGCATNQRKIVRPAPATPRAAIAPPPEAVAAAAPIGGYVLTPTSATIGTSGGGGNVLLTTPTWTATSSDPSWLGVVPSSGNTGTTLTWSALPNTGPARAGSLTIADQNFPVTQAGTTAETNIALVSGIPLNGTISASSPQSVWKYYYIDVPPGALNLSVDVYNMTADVDLYVRLGDKPTLTQWQCRPYIGGISENCNFPSPAAGRWWVGIVNYVTGTINYTVKATAITSTPPSTNIWVKGLGGTGIDSGTAVAYDSAGNIIVTGDFSGTVNFGGGPLTSLGAYDAFVAKYNSAGIHQWSKRFGGSSQEDVKAIALDSSGNIFLGGLFPSAGSLMKLTPQGDLIWTRGPQVMFSSIAVDSQGNVITTGRFSAPFNAPINFGDGKTIFSTPNGGEDVFLAKYSSGGVCLFAKDFVGLDNDAGTSVAVVVPDNIYLAGYSFTDINLGGAHFINGTWGAFGFLGRYTANGDHIWSRAIGIKSPTDNPQAWAKVWAIAVDGAGDVGVTGVFNYQGNFGGTPAIVAATYNAAFVAKYAGNDGHYLWDRPIAGSGNVDCTPSAITTDTPNNFLLTGYFRGSFDFGGQILSTPSTTSDCFVAKYGNGGGLTWAKQGGGSSNEGGYGISVDSQGFPVVAGYFSATAIFGGQSLTSNGSFDAVLWKLNP